MAQKKFVATIATQNGYCATEVICATLCGPKKSLLRPLRLKMALLRHCATELICATLCGPKKVFATIVTQNGYVAKLCDRNYLHDFVRPKKVCSNHCDSKWVCCDIVRPKLFARLCVAQKKFAATIATQNGYVETLCDRSYLRDFLWTKKSLLRPLRLKMGMVCCDIVQSKLFARLCVAKKKFVATIATTQIGCVATLCDRRYLRDFVWPKKSLLRPLRLKMGIVRPKLFARLCVAQKKFVMTIATKKWVCCDIVRPKLFARLCVAQKKFFATIATQNGYVATLCDRNYLHDFLRPKKSL